MSTDGRTARDAAAARRRRIAERGAERLALITGRVESISSSSAPLPPTSSDPLPLSDENTEKLGNDLVSDIQPVINNPETITETAAETSSKPRNIQSFPVTSTEQSQKSKSQTLLAFSPKRLRPAITSSEKSRRNCSLLAALLVLLSSAGFPILRSDFMKSIILFRPLFLLIVTNITIVVAPFLLENIKKEHRRSSTSDAGFANQIGTILEWGMLMKTGLSALFIDCSVYSVVVVCGVSFLQNFGS